MSELFNIDKNYSAWLKEIKNRFRKVQLKAAVKVNSEMLNFYWELGADIVEKQVTAKWGDGFLSKLSYDLMTEFPDMKGFSKRNLELIRQWYCFWSVQDEIAKQLATQIPWWHNVVIITKIKNTDEALFYVQKTIQNNWSRAVLTHQLESGLYAREGKAITNFITTLPEPQSDLARQTLKDPYNFDFLMLRETTDFEPEHVGKLNFYIKAVDRQFRQEGDQPTIGIILCKSKDKLVAEYALSDIHKPIGVSEYQLIHTLPDNLKPSLPSIEELEKELSEIGDNH